MANYCSVSFDNFIFLPLHRRSVAIKPPWRSMAVTNLNGPLSAFGFLTTVDSSQKAESRKRPIEICYCHTPPRWLYGYRTSVEWQKYKIIKAYGTIVGHFLRMYDFKSAQKVDYFIANSEETRKRIKKFYRRDATGIYPPVSLPKVG